jgi:hypothetical protein
MESHAVAVVIVVVTGKERPIKETRSARFTAATKWTNALTDDLGLGRTTEA